MESPDNPILVEATRGDSLESVHRGAVAVIDATGNTLFALGDPAPAIYPRSAIKPLQAIPLVESGAAERFALGDEEIALACSSHRGEPQHVQCVYAWLARLGLGEHDLECGVHPPRDHPAVIALAEQGRSPGNAHNNCSGKHSGFLTLARHHDWTTRGYIHTDHPVQQAWTSVLGELGDFEPSGAPGGIDGCGIPVVALPLTNLALAMARFAAPRSLGSVRGEAIARIHAAMTAAPHMVAGTGRFSSAVLSVSAGAALVKSGAEGVYVGAVPAAGLGIAIKIDDGATRASEVTMGFLLHALGALSDEQWRGLEDRVEVRLHNVAGTPVGWLRPHRTLREACANL